MRESAKLALAKYRSARGAFHQPIFIDSCVTIGPMFLSCLIHELIFKFCTSLSHVSASEGSLDIFQHVVSVG